MTLLLYFVFGILCGTAIGIAVGIGISLFMMKGSDNDE